MVVLLAAAPACGRGRDEPVPAAGPSDLLDERRSIVADADEHRPLESHAGAPSPADRPPPTSTSQDPAPVVPGPEDEPPIHFEGREIAQTMSYLGAAWLTRPERDAEEDATRM